MRYAKILGWACFAAMAGSLVYAFGRGDFRGEGGQIIRMPWGIVALADAYVGFSMFSGWVVYREKSLLRSGPWVAAFMFLGNIASAVYLLLAISASNGDWKRFWLGRRAEEA
jgi:hypothetical protein